MFRRSQLRSILAVSPDHPSLRMRTRPPSHATVMWRVQPSGHTPQGSGGAHQQQHSRRRIRSKSWEKVTSPIGALDTRWCHYQTLAPTQKGEKPAPEVENDREKGQNGHAITSGKHRNSSSRSNMKKPLKMQEKMGNAWVLVSRNVWPPHIRPLALPQLTVAALSYTHDAPPRPHPR
jgi:hypothetical protein